MSPVPKNPLSCANCKNQNVNAHCNDCSIIDVSNIKKSCHWEEKPKNPPKEKQSCKTCALMEECSGDDSINEWRRGKCKNWRSEAEKPKSEQSPKPSGHRSCQITTSRSAVLPPNEALAQLKNKYAGRCHVVDRYNELFVEFAALMAKDEKEHLETLGEVEKINCSISLAYAKALQKIKVLEKHIMDGTLPNEKEMLKEARALGRNEAIAEFARWLYDENPETGYGFIGMGGDVAFGSICGKLEEMKSASAKGDGK